MNNAVTFGITFGSLPGFMISVAATILTGFFFAMGMWAFNRWFP